MKTGVDVKQVCYLTSMCHVSPASANVCNVVLMRHSELSEGISVLDDGGNVVGTSKVAARHVRPSVRPV